MTKKDLEDKKLDSAKLEKKPIRRAQIENRGRIHIDESKKDKEFVYRIVNDTPGNIRYKKELGYEHVDGIDDIGDGSTSESAGLGAHSTVEVGIHKGAMKGYVMRCPKDVYDERQAAKHEDNLATQQAYIESNQRDDQKGK